MALEHLKLILMGGMVWGGPGSQTSSGLRATDPGPGVSLQEREAGMVSWRRPGVVGGGRKLAGTPSPSRDGPQPDMAGLDLGTDGQEGCGMGQGHASCLGSPNPPQIPENPAGLA